VAQRPAAGDQTCSEGANTSQEIADLCGLSRAKVFELVRDVRNGGLEAIWNKDPGGRPEGWRKGVSPQVTEEFEAKLEANDFVTLQDARRWLKKAHNIEVSYNRVWYWAKKLGRSASGAAPEPLQKRSCGG
jgi:transposase